MAEILCGHHVNFKRYFKRSWTRLQQPTEIEQIRIQFTDERSSIASPITYLPTKCGNMQDDLGQKSDANILLRASRLNAGNA